jgi:FG-GAP repeat
LRISLVAAGALAALAAAGAQASRTTFPGRTGLIVFSRGVAALVASAGPSFAVSRHYATGRAPNSVAIGDLNGDGRLDLATASGGAKTVSVLLNTPGLCTVQYVQGKTLQTAKQRIARANCGLGTIDRAYSNVVKRDAWSRRSSSSAQYGPAGAR